MPYVFVLILLLILVLVQPTSAQSSDVSALTDQFDKLVPSLLQEQNVPGASVALIHNKQVVWSKGYGVADVESGAPVTADTPFSVESIGKALTAWEIMRLVEAGRIDLDAPTNQYLTGWKIRAADGSDPNAATIRRVLSHTAGLSVDGYPGFTTADQIPTLEDFLDGANGGRRVEIVAPPGTRFSYSGSGYTVLQLLIQEMMGKPFAEVMQHDVLDPLGMTHSSFAWSPDLNEATAYRRDDQVEDRIVHLDQAAGGLYTSANDLARFFAVAVGMMGDWLKLESVALIRTAADATNGEYGFGNFLFDLQDGTPVVWHDGIGFGVRSVFVLLPASGDGMVILTNRGNGDTIFKDMICAWDLWLHAEQTKLCRTYVS